MEHEQSLFERMNDVSPVRDFDYALLTAAMQLACSQTPTARIAAGQAPGTAVRRREHREADRLVRTFSRHGIEADFAFDGLGSFNRFVAEWRR